LLQKDVEELDCSDDGGSEGSSCDAPCDIALMERLIRTHPVWFLPGIQRTGAVHLLQGKDEGVCTYQWAWSNKPDVVGSIPVTTEVFLISCDSNQVPK